MADVPGRTVGTTDDQLVLGDDRGADSDPQSDSDQIAGSGGGAEFVLRPGGGGLRGDDAGGNAELPLDLLADRQVRPPADPHVARRDHHPRIRIGVRRDGEADQPELRRIEAAFRK